MTGRSARWETLLIFPKRFISGETYRQLFPPLSLPLCHPLNTQPPLSVVLLRLSFRNTSPVLASSRYTSGLFRWKSREKPKKVLKSITLLFVQIQIVFRFYWKTFPFILCVSRERTKNLLEFLFFFSANVGTFERTRKQKAGREKTCQIYFLSVSQIISLMKAHRTEKMVIQESFMNTVVL